MKNIVQIKHIVITGILVIGAAWYGYNRDLTIIKESASDRMHAMQEACKEQGAEYLDMSFTFDSDGDEVYSLTCRMGVAR